MKNRNLWIFEFGSQESLNVLIRIIIGFQQRDRQDSQNLNNDIFSRLPDVSAQCFISTEKYPGSSILLNYHDVDYAQGYAQIKEVLEALSENYIHQPYISDNDFRTSNDGVVDVGYSLYVSDIR